MPDSSSDSTEDQYPDYGNHYRPRTTWGWIVLVAFLVLFMLTQPPIVHVLLDRPTVSVFGVPFLYVFLLAVYTALIGVLWIAYRKDL